MSTIIQILDCQSLGIIQFVIIVTLTFTIFCLVLAMTRITKSIHCLLNSLSSLGKSFVLFIYLLGNFFSFTRNLKVILYPVLTSAMVLATQLRPVFSITAHRLTKVTANSVCIVSLNIIRSWSMSNASHSRKSLEIIPYPRCCWECSQYSWFV